MKKAILMALFLALPMLSQAQELKLAKQSFAPGEDITVIYKASADYAGNAWVGIIPSNIAHGSEDENDKFDVAYQYLNKNTAGTLTFKAPAQAGNYDLRMHDTDSSGKEVASVSFTVGGAENSLKLSKTQFTPGEVMSVDFTASTAFPDNAWVGVIPSNVAHGSETENDKHDLEYKYLSKQAKGTLTFKAPASPGSYDLRMNDTDSDGKEVASITFAVK